jgi:hypothetical protein
MSLAALPVFSRVALFQVPADRAASCGPFEYMSANNMPRGGVLSFSQQDQSSEDVPDMRENRRRKGFLPSSAVLPREDQRVKRWAEKVAKWRHETQNDFGESWTGLGQN